MQSIAFLAHLLAHNDPGPHLIIVPASTLGENRNSSTVSFPIFNVSMFRRQLGARTGAVVSRFGGRALSRSFILLFVIIIFFFIEIFPC